MRQDEVMRYAWTFLLFFSLTQTALSQSYYSADFTLFSPDGTFLGSFDKNKYNSESIFNEYGNYGSRFSSTSIFNEFGSYGSRFSSKSPYNPYASEPPVILYRGRPFGRLTANRYLNNAIDPLDFFVFIRNQAR